MLCVCQWWLNGFIVDEGTENGHHVRSVVHSCFYQLQQLRSVRRSMTTDARRTLASAFIASRVDYCNAVLYRVSVQVTCRLQIVLNAAARLVVGASRRDHILPVLYDVLHWLDSRFSSRLWLPHSTACVRGISPAYFKDLCTTAVDTSNRANHYSSHRGDTFVPRTRTQLGWWNFRVAAPTVWNTLPLHLRSPSISRGHSDPSWKPISSI